MRSGDAAAPPAQAAVGLNMRVNGLRAVNIACLNSFQRSRDGVGMH